MSTENGVKTNEAFLRYFLKDDHQLLNVKQLVAHLWCVLINIQYACAACVIFYTQNISYFIKMGFVQGSLLFGVPKRNMV